jgi:ribosome-associated toxin RatA of RatAB toxin-antitoxin module
VQQRTCVGLAAAALALAAAPAYAAEDVTVQAERLGDAVEVRAQATIAAPWPLVWQVLTDYEDMPRFVPGIARSVVRSRDGNRLVLEHSGEARFLLFSFPIQVTLEVVESPMSLVTSRAIAGNVRRMSGRYELSERGAQGVLLRYIGLIEPDFDLPPLIGPAALRSSVKEQFTAMVAEIERRAGSAER